MNYVDVLLLIVIALAIWAGVEKRIHSWNGQPGCLDREPACRFSFVPATWWSSKKSFSISWRMVAAAWFFGGHYIVANFPVTII